MTVIKLPERAQPKPDCGACADPIGCENMGECAYEAYMAEHGHGPDEIPPKAPVLPFKPRD